VVGDSPHVRTDRLLTGLAPGAVVAGYQLESRIGIGGMAVVFRATDQRLGRTVALKVLAPQLAGDAEFRERFIRESRAAATVDHPHIIPVYEAGGADGILYLAMRYVSGGDLSSVMRREGPLRPERAAFLLSPVASALDAAHAARLVHRDVKPANVLIDMSTGGPDHPYLSDFGLAKGATSVTGLTATGQFLGTADYAAPEQISGGQAYVQTDQYALACLAFMMLTGALPFARDEPMAVLWAQLNDPPPSVAARRSDLSPAVDKVLGRALAKDPAARFSSCGDFAEALRAALGIGPYVVPGRAFPAQPAYPADPAWGGASGSAYGATTLRPGQGPPGWAAQTAEPAQVADGLANGPTDNGRGPGHSGPPGASTLGIRHTPRGLWRALIAVASAVAAVAAVIVTITLLHASSKHDGTTPPHTAGGGQHPAGGSVVTGSPVQFAIPGAPFAAAGFQPDSVLATVGTDRTVTTWNLPAHQKTARSSPPNGRPFGRTSFALNGTTLAAKAVGGLTYIFAPSPDIALPASDQLYPGSLNRTGRTIATGDPAGTGVDVWVGRRPNAAPAIQLAAPRGHRAHITSVAINADGEIVAGSDKTGRTYLWSTSNGTRTHVLTQPDGSAVISSAFSSSGDLLVTSNRAGYVYLWNPTTGRLLHTVRDPGDSADLLAIGGAQDTIATAGSGNAVYLWDGQTGARLAVIHDPDGIGVKSLAFNFEGSQLAVTDKNGTAYVWNLAGQKS
jgi:serine/threonine protein kinase